MALVKDPAAFKKAALEFARIVFIAAVSAALAGATVLIGLLDPIWAAVAGAALTAIGKAWDKYVHESDATTANGVVPF